MQGHYLSLSMYSSAPSISEVASVFAVRASRVCDPDRLRWVQVACGHGRSKPANRVLHVSGPDRRGQNRAGQGTCRVPLQHRPSHGSYCVSSSCWVLPSAWYLFCTDQPMPSFCFLFFMQISANLGFYRRMGCLSICRCKGIELRKERVYRLHA